MKLKLTELEARLSAMHAVRDDVHCTEREYVKRLRAEDRLLAAWFADREIALSIDRDPISLQKR